MSRPQVDDLTGLRSRLGARADAIVAAWKAALVSAGFVPLSGVEQREALFQLTEQFLDVFLEQPFAPDKAASIGAELVKVGYTRPAALSGTLEVFGSELPQALTDEDQRVLQPRLAEALAELSAGFAREMADRILADQETIRAALLTQRDRAAEALRESEARFRAIFTASPFGIAVTDVRGRVIAANPALRSMLGYDENELRGRALIAELAHPADAQVAADAFEELSRGVSERYELEQRLLTRDDRVIWAEMAMALVRNAEGQPQFAIVMGQDITQRKQAEAERMQLLREQAARAEAEAAQQRLAFLAEVSGQLASSLDYETTLRQVALAVVPRLAEWCALHLVDQHGELRMVAAVGGEPPYGLEDRLREVLGTGASRLLPEMNEHDHATAMIVPLTGQRGVLGTLLLITTADSGRRYDSADLALAEDLARRAALAVENARLYAEAQAATRTAEDAVRAREQFLSVAAHELKTPVTSLRGFAQLTLRALEQDAELDRARLQHALTVVNQQSEKLIRLVAQLLDISRIQAGRLALQLRTVDLTQLILGIVGSMQYQSHYHTLNVDGPPELQVRIDALRIEQVITNLVDNAIKYSPQGGTIDISFSSVDDDGVRIAVRDRGPGISVEHREHIFERFYQAGADAEHAAGMGLGLFISHEIVELHGGSIHAEFPPDGGAIFVVTLPAA